MKTEYAGIDYGLGRANIDAITGLRFGVISQNSLTPEWFGEGGRAPYPVYSVETGELINP
jgi:hypothetical protein